MDPSPAASSSTPLIDFLMQTIRSLTASQTTGGPATQLQPAMQSSLSYARSTHGIRYHMLRQSTEGCGTVILFYIIKEGEIPAVSLVGVDPKQTGHFTYRSYPSFPLPSGVLPHRSTNRASALSFLASLGAKQAVEGPVQIPPLPQDQLEAISRNDPLFSRPSSIERHSFTTWKEVAGRCGDGRSLKQFFLVDERTGHMKLAVNAEDSHRRDRRYTYLTTAEFGSLKLENGAATRTWLNMCCHTTDEGGGGGGGVAAATSHHHQTLAPSLGRVSSSTPHIMGTTPHMQPTPHMQSPPSLMPSPQSSHTSTDVKLHLIERDISHASLNFVIKEVSNQEFNRVQSWCEAIESSARLGSTIRVFGLLSEIEHFSMTLRLLIVTDIISSLRYLSEHNDSSISSKSQQIVAGWRECVAQVLALC